MSSIEQLQARSDERIAEIEKLTDRLAVLRREADGEAQARRESVKVKMRYTIRTVESNNRWDKVWDEMVLAYQIYAEVLNREAVEAVGGHVPTTGSMRYLFNLATGRLIGYTGGGNIYLGENEEAYAQVSAFLLEHPEGGDITEIVESTRGRG